jgi:DnaD/phage-associated family protein
MKTLTLKNKFQTNATLITNNFIDNYMIRANGEFVKVYLFLLRHLDDPCSSLTISMIADCLNHTENDVLRAFRYWETEGLLTLDKDDEDKIIGIELEQAPTINTKKVTALKTVSASEDAPALTAPAPSLLSPPTEAAPEKKAIALTSFKAQKELKSLFFIAEQYLGKTLSKTDVDAITYFYESLRMSADLIEYLIESCVENGHKSIHYIQKVALSWADSGVTTKEQARQSSMAYSKNCYTVLNAFGIKNRGPAVSELAFIKKWTEELGLSLELIQEACSRTISAIHQPSFEYADSILTKWNENNVHHLQDIAALDTAFQKEKSSKKTADIKQKPVSKNLNNFERRAYDMDSLEEQLLNSN